MALSKKKAPKKKAPPKKAAKAATKKATKSKKATKKPTKAASKKPSRSGSKKAASGSKITATAFAGFPRETLRFISALDKNNEKRWFDAHRADYDEYYIEPAKAFVEAMAAPLKKIAKGVNAEPRVNGSIFRINRDIRFSKDKTPYKAHLDLWFWDGPGRSWDCSGFYFRLAPNKLILGAGMHQFGKATLPKYRTAVASKKGDEIANVVAKLRKAGCNVGGAHYAKVPKGFDPDHPRAELLKHAGLFAGIEVAHPKELHTAKFVDYCVKQFTLLAPLHAWLRPLATKG